MPGLAGSDGSPLVAWPFVVKFLLLPRRPPAVRGLRCHHPPPRAPPRNHGRYAYGVAFHRRVLRHVPSSRVPSGSSSFHGLSSPVLLSLSLPSAISAAVRQTPYLSFRQTVIADAFCGVSPDSLQFDGLLGPERDADLDIRCSKSLFTEATRYSLQRCIVPFPISERGLRAISRRRIVPTSRGRRA